MHEAPQMDHRAIFPQPDAAVEEADYWKMYLTLFNQVTRAIDELDNQNPTLARIILMTAQQETEEIYITGGA